MTMETDSQIQKRFVVFLDIMGFKDRVARNTPENLYTELTEFNRDITNIINSSKEVDSDSLSQNIGTSETSLSISAIPKDKIMLAQFSDSIFYLATTIPKRAYWQYPMSRYK